MTATPEQLAQLRNVSTQANAIPYDDVQRLHEEPDWWTDDPNADGSFVCRDYVLLKAEHLRALGWAATDLTGGPVLYRARRRSPGASLSRRPRGGGRRGDG